MERAGAQDGRGERVPQREGGIALEEQRARHLRRERARPPQAERIEAREQHATCRPRFPDHRDGGGGEPPIVGAIAHRLPRRVFLVALDLVRAGIVLFLPFVTAVWQVYVLIFLLQACSAAFTPTFQATIADVLPDEKRYTEALSLSRLAYDLEALLSPSLASALLMITGFRTLFLGDAAGEIGDLQ